ncbi:MAG: nucleoside triphosphate pyrophosphohydrolase [Ruminococcaceae bacterium]|nr:nucleoside triphosphate pyrophosphohydrolase [Oscillospiraceae bacterium]
MDFTIKSKYDFSDLVEIMKILRSPQGCPWDRVQTHKSIRQNFIEETYEAVEAIDTEDTALLREELGDVMMQVVFHALMEEEVGSFNIDDVCDEVCKKLIVRHPHVFSDTIADTPDEVLKNWDQIKMQTKSQKSQSEVLGSVSKSLPALMYSQKIQHKAAKVGFDFEKTEDTLSKVSEELAELKEAIDNNDTDNMSEELGDLLFSVVNVARFIKVDSEKALYDATQKFTNRFAKVEELCKERNIDMANSSLSVLDSLWDEVK